jgi:hypothetical protein
MAAIEQELLAQIQKLNPQQQKQVLDFVHKLRQPVGEPIERLLARVEAINFPKEDLDEMARIIEEEDRIDWDDWNNPPDLSS